MSKLIELIKAYLPKFPSPKDADDAYLTASVDIFDLERRMKSIDSRSNGYCMSPLIIGMEGR